MQPLPSEKTPTSVNQTPVETNEFPQLPEGLEKKPIVLKFSAMLDGSHWRSTFTISESRIQDGDPNESPRNGQLLFEV